MDLLMHGIASFLSYLEMFSHCGLRAVNAEEATPQEDVSDMSTLVRAVGFNINNFMIKSCSV